MSFFVIPAKAGIQNALISIELWIPASAGMTVFMYFATVPNGIGPFLWITGPFLKRFTMELQKRSNTVAETVQLSTETVH